jgi:hypothetical protein
MQRSFLIKCEQCKAERGVSLDRSQETPRLNLPSSWMHVQDEWLVCSFRCAKRMYRDMKDKTISDFVMEKIFGFISRVPGVL